MYDVERREKIMELLKEHKSCSVAFLAKMLCFSEATIRRDLNELDKEMKVRKTFGGAVIIDRFGNEVPMMLRRNENASVKARLAKAASAFIKDNMTIFISASTTVEYIVPFLAEYSGLTIITNHPDIPGKLSGTNVNVYSTGGKYLHHSNSFVGEFARNMIKGINADLMFFSCRGISNEGKLTNSSTEEDITGVMMENSKKVCLVADSTKFGKIFSFTVGNLKQVDVVITDKDLPEGLEHPCVVWG